MAGCHNCMRMPNRHHHGGTQCRVERPSTGEKARRTVETLRMSSCLIALLVFSVLRSETAQAEDLSEALSAAYTANTTLKAARAGLKATNENLPRALAQGRPTILGTADFIASSGYEDPTGSFSGDAGQAAFQSDDSAISSRYSLSLNQPLFRGFSVVSAVREAKAEVYAGRSDLYETEQTTLLSAVTAYMDALRYRAVVGLRRGNVKVLNEQLSGTKERFDVGEATTTDVEQATARLAGARSDLSIAEANLKSAYAEYKRVIGKDPGVLSYPTGISSLLPPNLEDALTVSSAENPRIAAANFREEASRHAVARVRGELLPQVDLNLAYIKSEGDDNPFIQEDDLSITARVTVPLYQGGDVYARLRQSRQLNRQQRLLAQEEEERVRTSVIQAWSRLSAERARLKSGKVQVDANQKALFGIREQEKTGARSTLDVLDAEQEYVDAEIALANTRSDVVIAGFALLSAMGRATATDLGLSVQDPTTVTNGPGKVFDDAQDALYEFSTSWVPWQ